MEGDTEGEMEGWRETQRERRRDGWLAGEEGGPTGSRSVELTATATKPNWGQSSIGGITTSTVR